MSVTGENLPTTEHAVRRGTVRTLLRIVPFARQGMPLIILGMVAALVASLIALSVPQVLRWLIDGPLSNSVRDPRAIWFAALLVIGLGAAEAVFISLRRWLVLTPGTQIEARMRNALYEQLQDLPVSFHDKWPSGQLLSRAVSDLGLIRRWLSFGFVLLVVNLATIIVGFVFLIGWNWILGTLFFVASMPVWIYGFVFEKKYSIISRRSQDQSGDLATAVEESVHGIRVLKAFGRGGHALHRFEKQAESLRGTEIDKAKALAGIWLWLVLIPEIAYAVCLVVGVWLVSQHSLTVGEIIAFFATATVLRGPMESIGFLLSMTFDTRTAIDRFYEVMDEVNTIVDPAHPRSISDGRGELVFENVHFRYPDSPSHVPDLLDGVNLRIKPGETMALVGQTGSGKSTLTALSTRLYDVTGGTVRVDGVDVRDLTLSDLRRRVAMAFEEATLFSSSVRDNVLLGRNDLDPRSPEAERILREALSVAQATFVDTLPEGVDTKVGEEGLSLSGGQRQRLALARVVAARPDILVLDDPLSALDVDTEALVEAALREVLAHTTALIVAHRPSTVMLADRVAVLENGRITAVGPHQELLATSPHYRFVISSLEQDADEHSHSEVTL